MFSDNVAVFITDSSVTPTSEDRPSLVLGLSVHSHLGRDRCSRKVWGLVTLPVSLCHGEALMVSMVGGTQLLSFSLLYSEAFWF